MKKLMFGLVAAAACSAMAEITSANIVGYSKAPLRAGFTMSGADFIGVGSDSVDLTSFEVGGEAYVAGGSASVDIQILNYDGTTAETYYWLDIEGDFDPGWYNEDYELVEKGDVTFGPGDGLWVEGDDGLDLSYSGEVLQKTAVTIPLRAGFTPAANPFPVALDLTKITVGGEAYVAGGSASVDIQILNYDGTTDSTYYWLDIEGDFEPGWYNEDYELVEEASVFLPISQGLWVEGDDDLNLQIPALTL